MNVVEALAMCCGLELTRTPLTRSAALELSGAIKVLADPARLQLLSVIAALPGREACVCNLIGPLQLSQPTVSHHLKVLHEAGLLEREQRGRWAFYRIKQERLEPLREVLAPTA